MSSKLLKLVETKIFSGFSATDQFSSPSLAYILCRGLINDNCKVTGIFLSSQCDPKYYTSNCLGQVPRQTCPRHLATFQMFVFSATRALAAEDYPDSDSESDLVEDN